MTINPRWVSHHCGELTVEEEKGLFRWYQSQPPGKVRERFGGQFIAVNIKLVQKVISKHFAAHCQQREMREDLLAEGKIAMLTAMEKFDLKRGYRFSTFAFKTIRQNVQRELPLLLGGPKTGTYQKLMKFKRVGSTGSAKTDLIYRDACAIMSPLSLFAMVVFSQGGLTAESDCQLIDLLPDPVASPEAQLLAKCQREAIAEAFARLPERERIVITDVILSNRHLAETAKTKLGGVSKERARQLKQRGLARLRDEFHRLG